MCCNSSGNGGEGVSRRSPPPLAAATRSEECEPCTMLPFCLRGAVASCRLTYPCQQPCVPIMLPALESAHILPSLRDPSSCAI